MSPQELLNNFNPTAKRNWTSFYYGFDTKTFTRQLSTEPEALWLKLGNMRALQIFHSAARGVPAYQDFLKKHRIKHEKIRTIQDFTNHVPPTDKDNYVNRYSIAERCYNGSVTASNIIAVSSGTSGEPKFWPRSGYQEFEAAVIHEQLYQTLFDIDKYSTLIVVGFPMGIYVSGVATVLPTWMSSQRRKNVTVVSVGTNKAEILRTAQRLGPEYEQVVLIGHPFFIKDVIESGAQQGIDWAKQRTAALFCSEGFNEAWRDYVSSHLEPTPRVFSTYGSSELLLMGTETPLTVALRKRYEANHEFNHKIFNSEVTPSLFQYNPLLRYIESFDKELLFTCASGTPLVRYNLHDLGNVHSFQDITSDMTKQELKELKPLHLPFVSLGGRTDSAIVFYAANIYQAHIHSALNQPELLKLLTGKFFMRKDYLPNMDQFLELHIEMKQNVKPLAKYTKLIQQLVVQKLKIINMEYAFIAQHLGKDVRPVIKIWPYGHEQYFKTGMKPRFM